MPCAAQQRPLMEPAFISPVCSDDVDAETARRMQLWKSDFYGWLGQHCGQHSVMKEREREEGGGDSGESINTDHKNTEPVLPAKHRHNFCTNTNKSSVRFTFYRPVLLRQLAQLHNQNV